MRQTVGIVGLANNNMHKFVSKSFVSQLFGIIGFANDNLHMFQSVTFVKKLIRTNIRIYSYQNLDTNEYPNIFVSKF